MVTKFYWFCVCRLFFKCWSDLALLNCILLHISDYSRLSIIYVFLHSLRLASPLQFMISLEYFWKFLIIELIVTVGMVRSAIAKTKFIFLCMFLRILVVVKDIAWMQLNKVPSRGYVKHTNDFEVLGLVRDHRNIQTLRAPETFQSEKRTCIWANR